MSDMGSPRYNYLDMTGSIPRNNKAALLEEQDINGYLRPTFPVQMPESSPIKPRSRQASLRSREVSQADSDYVSESAEQPSLSVIPPESYGVTQESVRGSNLEIVPTNDYSVPSDSFSSDCTNKWSDSRTHMQYLNSEKMNNSSNSSSKSHSPSEPLMLSSLTATEV
jgi:hypothetical protein